MTDARKIDVSAPAEDLPPLGIPRGRGVRAAPGLGDRPARRRLIRRGIAALTGAIGTVSGLVPHVLHHIGPLAGAALLAGAGGTALFGVLGLLLSVPFLVRLRRRFGNWRAPGLALVVFAAGFALSTYLIGPALRGDDGSAAPAIERPQAAPASGHEAHH